MELLNPAEARIRDWCTHHLAETLKIRPERIDPDVKFARFGLDSAMSIFFVAAIEDWLGIALQAELVFQYQTVKDLARHLAQQPEIIVALDRLPA